MQNFKQPCLGKFGKDIWKTSPDNKSKTKPGQAPKHQRPPGGATAYYSATTLLISPFLEREIPAVLLKDSPQLLRPSQSSAKWGWDNPVEGRWNYSAVVRRRTSIVLRLLKYSMVHEDSVCEHTLHSGCWKNSGLKIGFSFYSYSLNTRLILGLYPALEHLHLLIFSGAAAFPQLKDVPCQKKMVYANCWCL